MKSLLGTGFARLKGYLQFKEGSAETSGTLFDVPPSPCYRDVLQARNSTGEFETEQGGNQALHLACTTISVLTVNQSSPGSDRGNPELQLGESQ